MSVIIPVYNDRDRLKICLEALENQTYPHDLYEIIVVDNASNDDVAATVALFGKAVVIEEKQQGSYVARNKGISIAKGEVIAFTDSDCIPANDWIEKGVHNLLNTSNCGIVGGKIDIFFKDPEQPTAVELYDGITAFPQSNYVKNNKFAVSANLCTFKKILDEVGSFNAELKSGGDYEWGQRVFKAGYKVIYAEDTRVAHPARYSFKELHKKMVRVIGGKYDLTDKSNASSSKEFIKDLFRDLIPPLKFVGITFGRKELQIDEKLKVIYVRFFFKYGRAFERIKLLMGIGKNPR
ncbi:MAG: glycosyltransferase [Cyanobacteriota bacterium]|nr:glycosyltransferase [Cyanobacteriota bacterium]